MAHNKISGAFAYAGVILYHAAIVAAPGTGQSSGLSFGRALLGRTARGPAGGGKAKVAVERGKAGRFGASPDGQGRLEEVGGGVRGGTGQDHQLGVDRERIGEARQAASAVLVQA